MTDKNKTEIKRKEIKWKIKVSVGYSSKKMDQERKK